jgi:hypothetical protein
MQPISTPGSLIFRQCDCEFQEHRCDRSQERQGKVRVPLSKTHTDVGKQEVRQKTGMWEAMLKL